MRTKVRTAQEFLTQTNKKKQNETKEKKTTKNFQDVPLFVTHLQKDMFLTQKVGN